MKNDEEKISGALQYKVWNPGRLQPTRKNDSKGQGQLQTKVWDPGKHKLKTHDQVVMIYFYFGSPMQAH